MKTSMAEFILGTNYPSETGNSRLPKTDTSLRYNYVAKFVFN